VIVLIAAALISVAAVLRAQRLRLLSITDRLTGAANRGFFDQRLAEEESRARRYGHAFAIAIMDVDHFKRFNDTYGHVAGDGALQTLAETLKSSIRKSDLVARYGGEEFALILPETGLEEAAHKIELIRRLVDRGGGAGRLAARGQARHQRRRGRVSEGRRRRSQRAGRGRRAPVRGQARGRGRVIAGLKRSHDVKPARGDWLAPLILVHRWLGIGFGLLFVVWFASGIAMMYARMPGVAPLERLSRAETLLPDALALSPHEVATKLGLRGVDSLQLAVLRAPPVYRFPAPRRRPSTRTPACPSRPWTRRRRWTSPAASRRSMRRARARTGCSRKRTNGRCSRGSTCRCSASRSTTRTTRGLYVSRKSGEVVMKTTRRERLLAYVGPVLHWLYFPALRRNGRSGTV
jgi:GGDEF domain-containing protein